MLPFISRMSSADDSVLPSTATHAESPQLLHRTSHASSPALRHDEMIDDDDEDFNQAPRVKDVVGSRYDACCASPPLLDFKGFFRTLLHEEIIAKVGCRVLISYN